MHSFPRAGPSSGDSLSFPEDSLGLGLFPYLGPESSVWLFLSSSLSVSSRDPKIFFSLQSFLHRNITLILNLYSLSPRITSCFIAVGEGKFLIEDFYTDLSK